MKYYILTDLQVCDQRFIYFTSWSTATKIGVVAASGIAAVAATPVVLGAAGFTAAGVAAGSVGAGMMSLSGGSVAAGGLVATLQSVGAAGLSTAGTAVVATAGAAVGKIFCDIFSKGNEAESGNEGGSEGSKAESVKSKKEGKTENISKSDVQATAQPLEHDEDDELTQDTTSEICKHK